MITFALFYIWAIVGVFFFWFLNHDEELRKGIEGIPPWFLLANCLVMGFPAVLFVLFEEFVKWYKGEEDGER